MTNSVIAMVISVFCGFNDAKISSTYKFDCMDHMINCVVDKAGSVVSKEEVDSCKANFNKGKRYGDTPRN